jgi:hypothetical protein
MLNSCPILSDTPEIPAKFHVWTKAWDKSFTNVVTQILQPNI